MFSTPKGASSSSADATLSTPHKTISVAAERKEKEELRERPRAARVLKARAGGWIDMMMIVVVVLCGRVVAMVMWGVFLRLDTSVFWKTRATP